MKSPKAMTDLELAEELDRELTMRRRTAVEDELLRRQEPPQLAKNAGSDNDLWFEYMIHEVCGLCANSGVVNTRGIKTRRGAECGVRTYCICPNGRALKRTGAKLRHWTDGRGTIG